VFPRARFEHDLLEELLRTCSHTVWIEGDRVIVDLAYIERKLVPLNVFVREAEPAQAKAAILEYAEAVEDLASCNIFPGDLLLKNFGVTRHGRVALAHELAASRSAEATCRSLIELAKAGGGLDNVTAVVACF